MRCILLLITACRVTAVAQQAQTGGGGNSAVSVSQKAAPAPDARTAGKTFQLETGRDIPVLFISDVAAEQIAEGDQVPLETLVTIYASGRAVIPKDSSIKSTVIKVVRPDSTGIGGEFSLRFDSLTLPNGVKRDFPSRGPAAFVVRVGFPRGPKAVVLHGSLLDAILNQPLTFDETELHFPDVPARDGRLLQISQIVILPPIDSRSDKKLKVNLKGLRDDALQILSRAHNYSVIKSDVTGDAGEITEANLKTATPEWIKRLGPPGARWVMVVGLGGVDGGRFTSAASVFGFLYDVETGGLLWHGNGFGQPESYHQNTDVLAGGLATLIAPGVVRNGVVGNALVDLLNGPSGFPVLPKKKK